MDILGMIIDIIRDNFEVIAENSLLKYFSWSLIITAIGIIVGYLRERRFLRHLEAREAALSDIRLLTTKRPESESDELVGYVECSIVLSRDLFRTFFVFLRRVFGGNIKGFERLADMARREAMIRLKEDAAIRGGNLVINVRVQTLSLSRQSPMVEAVAYGTALRQK